MRDILLAFGVLFVQKLFDWFIDPLFAKRSAKKRKDQVDQTGRERP